MSLRIKHLNADTSWLLIFSPPFAGPNLTGSFPGSFTVLIDPWLSGPSKVWSSKFSLTEHRVPSCVESLAQLPEPDVVVVSQDKSDHCNEATLKQLSPSTQATIVGPPATAKKIKSWRYFESANIIPLKRYDPHKEDTVLRIEVPPFSPTGSAGEVTISLMVNKVDVTGLHNAIGITYRAPSSVLSTHTGSYVDLPITPPTTPPETSESGPILASNRSTSSVRPMSPPSMTVYPPPLGGREKTLSVIYSPHGLSYNLIKPYATSHLLSEAALPLTALFHCFDRVSNPWYLGGNVCSGFPNGLEIAEGLFAKTWISAHDEDKESSGISVKNLTVEKYKLEDIKRKLNMSSEPGKRRCNTDIVELGVGQDYLTLGK